MEEYKQRAKPQKIQKAESTEKKLNTKKRTKNKKTNPERVKSQANSGKVANAPKAKGDTPEARALRLLQHLSKKKSKDG